MKSKSRITNKEYEIKKLCYENKFKLTKFSITADEQKLYFEIEDERSGYYRAACPEETEIWGSFKECMIKVKQFRTECDKYYFEPSFFGRGE